MKNKLVKLLQGENVITSERGNSMMPLISDGQQHELAPATWESVEVGDIVYCKVNGLFLYPFGESQRPASWMPDR